MDQVRGGNWNRHKEEMMLLEYEEEQSNTQEMLIDERKGERLVIGMIYERPVDQCMMWEEERDQDDDDWYNFYECNHPHRE